MKAAKCGHPGCIAELVAHEADLMPRRKNGQTPLHEAALGGFVDCVKLILEAAGPDQRQLIEAVDNEGNTALDLAVNNIPSREVVAGVLREAAQQAAAATATQELHRNVACRMTTEAYVKEHKMEKTMEDLLNSLKSQPENPYTAMVRRQSVYVRCRSVCQSVCRSVALSLCLSLCLCVAQEHG